MSKIKTQINLIKFSKRKLIKLIITLEESNNIIQEQFNIQNEQLKTQQELTDNQQKQIDIQQALIEKFESKLKALSKDSSNSSKPPSTDNNIPKKNQSLRKKSGKKSGGQKGRTGVTRKQNNKPDEIISCRPKKCDHCGKDLSNKKGEIIAKRQEINIPTIAPVIIEYRQETIKCSCGHCNNGVFPNNINSQMQFGINIKTFITYLNIAHKIPYHRLGKIMVDMLNIQISEGSIENILEKCREKSNSIYFEILKSVKRGKWAGSDETGTHVNGKKWWQWVWQNTLGSFYCITDSRGYKVVKEYFGENYWGVLIHDCWSAQNNTIAKLGHQLCHPHLIRDLNYLIDSHKNIWCYKMKQLLLASQRARDKIWKSNFDRKIQKIVIAKHNRQLEYLLVQELSGKKEIATIQKRFRKHKEKILFFMSHKSVPFHNNSSERAIRNAKIHKKISGGFRSVAGAERHAVILSVIETCKKRDLNVLDSLRQIFLGTFSLRSG